MYVSHQKQKQKQTNQKKKPKKIKTQTSNVFRHIFDMNFVRICSFIYHNRYNKNQEWRTF